MHEAPSQNKRMQYCVAVLLRLVLFFTFAVAALSKAKSIENFEDTLAASLLIPSGMVHLAALATIAVELVLAGGLLSKSANRHALQGIICLSAVFISYSAWRYFQQISVPCQCFGVLLKMSPLQSVLLNVAIVTGASWLLLKTSDNSAKLSA